MLLSLSAPCYSPRSALAVSIGIELAYRSGIDKDLREDPDRTMRAGHGTAPISGSIQSDPWIFGDVVQAVIVKPGVQCCSLTTARPAIPPKRHTGSYDGFRSRCGSFAATGSPRVLDARSAMNPATTRQMALVSRARWNPEVSASGSGV